MPADRKGVAFELRETARWHDGRPVTADDVVWTFNTLRQHGRPFYRAYWADVTEVVAEGPRRVVFRFKDDGNRELALILGQLTVLPRHWWEGRDFARPTLDVPLGSGPYRIERFEAGRCVVYRRVEDYWARDLPTAQGTSNFDTMRYEYFRDSTVALEAFKAGQIDFRTENTAKDWATAYDFPAVQRGLVKRDEIRHELPTGMQAFAVNLRRPLFQDARVRRALIEVFDFEWMNANLFYGAYARTRSYFSNSELASSGLPEGREREILERFRGRVPEQLFTEEYKLPVTDGSGNNREALRRALDLLRQAGWTVRDRRLVNAQGQPFAFEILLNGPSFERVALPYVQVLQRLGMEPRVRTVDPAQYQVRIGRLRLRHDGGGHRPEPLARQRAARLLHLRPRQRPRQPERRRHLRPGGGRAGGDGRRRAGPRGAGGPHPRAGPRAAVAQLHDPAMAQPHLPRRLLGQVRPAGAQPALPLGARLAGGSSAGARARWSRASATRAAARRRRRGSPAPPMGAYLLRRLLLVVPTLLGIILINFAVVQFAPGGPVEQMLAELRGEAGSAIGRLSGESQGESRGPRRSETGGGNENSRYRGARGLDPAVVAEIERAFGFDKPWHERLLTTLWGYLRFDLGRSLFQDRPVARADPGQAAGLRLARPLVHADHLPGVHSARASARRCGTARASTWRPPARCWWATPSPASCSPSCWWCSSPAAASSSGSRCAAC